MDLNIKLLSGELLRITISPEEEDRMSAIREAIHAMDPKWEPYQMRFFTMGSSTGDIEPEKLSHGDCICLFIDEPCYVRILANSEHVLFGLSVSNRPDLPYPHTRTLIFEYDRACFYDYSQRHETTNFESMIRRSGEFPRSHIDYIVQEAQKQWDVIMLTYAQKREEFLQRYSKAGDR